MCCTSSNYMIAFFLCWLIGFTTAQPSVLVYYQDNSVNKAALSYLQSQAGTIPISLEITDKADYFSLAENNVSPLFQFSAIVFLNVDGKSLTPSQRSAVTHYVNQGYNFAAIGTACSGESKWGWLYDTVIGTTCLEAPNTVQTAQVIVADRHHPSTSHLPLRWNHSSIWLDFEINVRRTHHVLATVTESTYSGGHMGFDHPITWCKELKKSRLWYSALGAVESDWQDPSAREHLLGGIKFVAGVADGDCTASLDEYYEKTIIATEQREPLALDIAPDGRVFWVDRGGTLRIYKPDTATVVTSARFPVTNDVEDGLLGIALDANFEETNWIYVYYSPPTPVENRLSRFTMDGDNVLWDSEVILLSIPVQRIECCHSAGHLLMDKRTGYLFLSVGDNTSPYGDAASYAALDERPGREYFDAQRTSANTQDLRGKILRIKPRPDGGYDIPPGNLFTNPQEGRPEIFVMGVRNPYRMAIDPLTGTLYWAEVGPNAEPGERGPRGVDEVNVAREAGNYGWPYCIGPNEPYAKWDFATQTGKGYFDCSNLVNESPNLDKNGARRLPPARPAMIYYGYAPSPEFPEFKLGITSPSQPGRCAMLGPYIRTNASVDPNYAANFPRYFDNTLIFMEWRRQYILEFKMDEEGNLLKINPLWDSFEWDGPIDMKIAPDGTAYVVEYGTDFEGLIRPARISMIRYTRDRRSPVCSFKANPTSGGVPLTVTFKIDVTDATQQLTYKWNFDDEEVETDETEIVHTYNQAGVHNAILTITGEEGAQSKCSQQIVVGNTAPVISTIFPFAGSVFQWGGEVPYVVAVQDVEDGSTDDGSIDCDNVEVQPGLGHDNHVHTFVTQRGCTGTITAIASGHEGESNIFYVLTARYTDKGGSDGVPPLDTEDIVVLQPSRKEAETVNSGSLDTSQAKPTEDVDGFQDIAGIVDGAYLCFNRFNLFNIHNITMRVRSSKDFDVQIRKQDASGEVIAKIKVPASNSYINATSTPIDPKSWPATETLPLCFVFSIADAQNADIRFNWFALNGPGASRLEIPPSTPSQPPSMRPPGTSPSISPNSPPRSLGVRVEVSLQQIVVYYALIILCIVINQHIM